MERPVWRLLVDEPRDGYTNMAIDEAVMQAHAEGKAPPTVRFFRWSPACVSLGYFQSAEGEVDFEACRKLGIDCVRRPTGGRAILHDAELTYSLVAGIAEAAVSGSIVESYRKISAALLMGLRQLGVEAEMKPLAMRGPQAPGWALSEDGQAPHTLTAACFDVPSDYEIAVNGRKLIGSAQTRREGVLLQHGSLLFMVDARRIFTVLKPPANVGREEVAEWLSKRVTSLQDILQRPVTFDEVGDSLRYGLAEELGIRLERSELSSTERNLMARLRREKYSTREWNFLR